MRLVAMARAALLIFAQLFVLLNQVVVAVTVQLFWAEVFLGLLACSAIFTFFQFKHSSLGSTQHLEEKVKLQLVLDVILLSLLFYVSGGAANPFVSILLFPLVISALILPGRFNGFMVLFTLSCYGSLFIFEQGDFKQHSVDHAVMPSNAMMNLFSLHIVGMWFNFAISAVLISFFIVKMRQEIDRQQMQLNQQREQSLRDEQILGIATQAASAAHHLGTPLSTMNVILSDFSKDAGFPEAYKEELVVLLSQVENCKDVLNSLRHQAEHTYQADTLQCFLATLINEFHLLRPQITLQVDGLNDLPEHLNIMADSALRMAILNILNNAGDASPARVIFHPYYAEGDLCMDITDFGEGFDVPSYRAPVLSEKQDGLGLGLFLSHATLSRYGGKIRVTQQDTLGSCVHIRIPINT